MIIKFNLLPKPKETVKEEIHKEPFRFYKLIIPLVIFVLSVMLSGIISMEKQKKDLIKEKTTKETKLKEYKMVAQKVEQLEKENEEVKRRIETILSLKKDREKILKRLDVVLSNLGKTQVYFSLLKISSNQTKIEGISADMKEVGEYLRTLEEKKDIVRQVNITQVKKQDKLVEFQAEVSF
ncbi:PilN domain-containing protein [Thermodesulfobacterium hveragerdense]|uniref:PilN domain-containing protein n=1 Tax=Thermodesulfobacterium hveragerdense TaxID=53424 RepID=UPI0003FA9AFD|nr:PilN domain-containing protein [Thermodesulfobacterium hveragerdense]